uniref:Transferrin n=1 Tax=Dolopus genitalis TaxID=2488630 RepID=A0A3G5BIM0_DOLGE|nr:venom polypeptide [Dolopus genitalis]
MSRSVKVLTFLCLLGLAIADEPKKIYKMCIPHIYYNDCLKVLEEPSNAGILMECVPARDRMECLEKVNKREADVIAVDPEDMYVAYHMNNEDFHVISEIRTDVEKDAQFRYEGIILVKKSSPVKSLEDLKGMKSCHTGFGRNVGYKIPITKLKNSGILKVELDPHLAPTERELKALSQFFSKSCLVGTYSPYPEVDKELKKKYSNLCALCEKPEQCNYPDKFSGYDGAIRCLDQGEGDVAFTKTSFVKKYFGMIGDKPESTKPEDFEYLCEDGTRRPLTGPVCSWAQRPWQGYMTNADTVKGQENLKTLQNRLDTFFHNGRAVEKSAAEHLLIKPDLILHEKKETIMPKEYLERAGYKDVIERDGSMAEKVRFCITNDIELEKCNTLRQAAYSRDIRPEFQCVVHSKDECIKAIKEKNADVVVLHAEEYQKGHDGHLKPLIYESFGDDNVYVAIADSNASHEVLAKTPLKYDKNNKRARYAAYLLNSKRGKETCQDSADSGDIEIVNSKDLSKHSNKQLVCLDLTAKPVSEYKTCNVEAALPNAAFVRDDLSDQDKGNLVHAFISLSDRFRPHGKNEDVFEMFGEFKQGYSNVLFNDEAVAFVTEFKPRNEIDEKSFSTLHCKV